MGELSHKEGWALKKWWFWIVVLEKTFESPLDCKEIKPVKLKENQSWIFIGSTDAEAPILWTPGANSWLIRKDSDAGKDWRQEEKGMTEDEIVGWHHWLNGHEFKHVLEVGEGQESLACCSPWGHKGQTWLSAWTTNNNGTLNEFYFQKLSSNLYFCWQNVMGSIVFYSLTQCSHNFCSVELLLINYVWPWIGNIGEKEAPLVQPGSLFLAYGK